MSNNNTPSPSPPTRTIGLDIHKHYLVATGVDRERKQVFGPQHVPIGRLKAWAHKQLKKTDAVVVEMTTNTYAVYDALLPLVQSVTVVHPPHMALIVRAQVKTDKKAALTLAQLHSAGLLPAVWIPPQPVRDLRAVLAQRQKMVRMETTAKNRLHAVLQRNNFTPPSGFSPFAPEKRGWWQSLPLTEMERFRIVSDLDTLEFASKQVERLEERLKALATADARIPLLVQTPGIGLITALAILAAIGDITRFPSDKQLVGYAGLGTRVHDSGLAHANGRITKAGRRDLRKAMVDAANHAILAHPHWQAQYALLEPRSGRSKAIVAIARKLLVVVWHVLTKGVADKNGQPDTAARQFFGYVYRVGVKNLPDGQTARQFTRSQLDRIGFFQPVEIRWGSKRFKLPVTVKPCEGPPEPVAEPQAE